MDNWFGGGNLLRSYKADRLHASLGGALNRYDGDHFGRVLWSKCYRPSEPRPTTTATPQRARRNIYLKANYELVSGLSAYLDLQYRHINYKINGLNSSTTGLPPRECEAGHRRRLRLLQPWTVTVDRNRLYGSFSVAHKKNLRATTTDGYFTEHPKATGVCSTTNWDIPSPTHGSMRVPTTMDYYKTAGTDRES